MTGFAKRSRLALKCLLAAGLATAFAVPATHIAATDVPGSHDSPIVSRFRGSVIVGYQALDYGRMDLPMGKYEHGKLPTEAIEGRITRIAYVAPEGKEALEVFRNFQQALAVAGFQTRFECHGSDGANGCGDGFEFANAVTTPLFDPLHARNVMVQTLNAVNGNVHAITARLQRQGGPVDVALLVSKSDRNPTGILLQICESKAMATAQVTVDAKAMSQGLAQAGHIALYGIRFATDSAALDPASKDTLAQMAALLARQPSLKVYIVGHTDDTGSLAHNLALSQQRAEAVVKALVDDYRVAPARLAAKGLASFAPVASNRDEAGRARNRRVELVEQ